VSTVAYLNTVWNVYAVFSLYLNIRGLRKCFMGSWKVLEKFWIFFVSKRCRCTWSSGQARRDIWPGGQFNTDPRRLWDFLERIGVVTRPLTGNEREREREWLVSTRNFQVTVRFSPRVICRQSWVSEWVSELGLTSRSAHYRSFRKWSSRQSLVRTTKSSVTFVLPA